MHNPSESRSENTPEPGLAVKLAMRLFKGDGDHQDTPVRPNDHITLDDLPRDTGRNRIALVLKGYPRLSETFIAQEFLAIEKAGFDCEIVSLRRPHDPSTHPVHAEITLPVRYLPEYLHHEPWRVIRSWWKARRLPGYKAAEREFLADLMRDFSRNRFRRFGQGMVMAAEISADTGLIYVHFLHTPASTARYAATLRDIPFAISAHAKDIWTSPAWEIREKLEDCQWLVTCTSHGYQHLQSLSPDPAKVHLVYHGIDLSRFPPNPEPPSRRDGASDSEPLRIITVGRAVAKKGIDTLIEALARLPQDFHWQWTHIGAGQLQDELQQQAQSLGLGNRCQFLGARPQAEVIEAYRNSDFFVMPCRIDKSGDRDGLPNVFVEAQSQRLAVISTPISGITELIENGTNGVLVAPDDVEALTAAIVALGRSPQTRQRMGEAGEKIVRTKFDHTATIGALISLLDTMVERQ